MQCTDSTGVHGKKEALNAHQRKLQKHLLQMSGKLSKDETAYIKLSVSIIKAFPWEHKSNSLIRADTWPFIDE